MSIGSLESRIGTLSIEKQEALEKDAVKAEKKAEKKAEAEQKKKEVSVLTRHFHYCWKRLTSIGRQGMTVISSDD